MSHVRNNCFVTGIALRILHISFNHLNKLRTVISSTAWKKKLLDSQSEDTTASRRPAVVCICWPGRQCKLSLIVDKQRTKYAANEMRLKGYQGSGFDCTYTLWLSVLCHSLPFFFFSWTLLLSCPQNKVVSYCGGKLEASFTSYWAC